MGTAKDKHMSRYSSLLIGISDRHRRSNDHKNTTKKPNHIIKYANWIAMIQLKVTINKPRQKSAKIGQHCNTRSIACIVGQI